MDKQQRQLEQRLARERRDNQIEVTRIDEETLRLDVRSEASFDINSDRISDGFRDSLKTMAEVIGEYDKTAVHVIGHTDNTGTESYNQALSERRATSVTRYLSRNGVDRSRMRFSGRGELNPVDTNTTSSGRSRNRRVEVYLKTVVKGRENEAFRAPI
jgi:outer membrane protein OmpA-like peptidoglycan-associated protein